MTWPMGVRVGVGGGERWLVVNADDLGRARGLQILRGIGPDSTELMCHPGWVDDELRAGSSYVDERERELAVLCDPAARALAAELGLRLARFGEACAS